MVYCTYLQREAEGLERVPYPGELGKRIYENISAEAWRAWVAHQTMLLNEYRLSPIDPKGAQVSRRGNGKIPVRRRVGETRRLRRTRIGRATAARALHARTARTCSATQIQPSMNATPPSGVMKPMIAGARVPARKSIRKKARHPPSTDACTCDPARRSSDLREQAQRKQGERMEQVVGHAGLERCQPSRRQNLLQRVRPERTEDDGDEHQPGAEGEVARRAATQSLRFAALHLWFP
jgi:Fe-S cluster biosynthesis and repair protein YggX